MATIKIEVTAGATTLTSTATLSARLLQRAVDAWREEGDTDAQAFKNLAKFMRQAAKGEMESREVTAAAATVVREDFTNEN